MSTCPYCNQTANAADGLCEYCGAVLPAPISTRQDVSSPGSNTRRCPSCQSPLTPDDEVCNNCGAFVPVSSVPISSALVAEKCPRCNTTRTVGKPFCGTCGYKFLPSRNPSMPTHLPAGPV